MHIFVFNGAAGMSCLCWIIVGINKHYLPITYTQSHDGEKCKYHGIMCTWLSEYLEFHTLIPVTANLVGKLVLEPQPPINSIIVDAFFLTTLTVLQVKLNKKLLEVTKGCCRSTCRITRCLSLFLLFKFLPPALQLLLLQIRVSTKAQAAADEQK